MNIWYSESFIFHFGDILIHNHCLEIIKYWEVNIHSHTKLDIHKARKICCLLVTSFLEILSRCH